MSQIRLECFFGRVYRLLTTDQICHAFPRLLAKWVKLKIDSNPLCINALEFHFLKTLNRFYMPVVSILDVKLFLDKHFPRISF
jgi:hypothetical protein